MYGYAVLMPFFTFGMLGMRSKEVFMDAKAMYRLSYGLFVLTARGDGSGVSDNGCIINTAQQVTTDPNQITIAVNKANYTHDLIMKNRQFNVSILSEAAGFDLFTRFGFQTGREHDKFAGFEGNFERSKNGIVYVTSGTNAFISADVVSTVDLGTHTLFISRVSDMDVLDEKTPSATYAYYQSNIKPRQQAPKKSAKTKTVWRCRICGYIYEGDELPADFVCPVCKHGASDFERVEIEA